MRTETIKRELYLFNELNKKAQERALNQEIDNRNQTIDLNDYWAESMTENIREKYPYLEDIKLYFSLGYSQGDGVSIEADVNLKAFLKHKGLYNKLAWVLEDDNTEIYLSVKCVSDRYFGNGSRVETDLYNDNLSERANKQIERIKDLMQDDINNINKETEKSGYLFIEDSTSEDTIKEYFKDFEIEFLESGEIA